METPRSQKNAILTCIPFGRSKAVTVLDVKQITGISERTVKDIINSLRKEGEPIVSLATGGYFITDPKDEMDVRIAERFVAMQQAQAMERLKSCNPVKRWLANLKQMKLEGV